MSRGIGKAAYKPVGVLMGLAAGAVAGVIFRQVWKVTAGDGEAPSATDEDRGWGEILAAAAPMAHPSGTCAIGRAGDPNAVVDPHCRVHGIERLRVVDASVMPTVPSANTNLTAIMIAERAAELIGSESR